MSHWMMAGEMHSARATLCALDPRIRMHSLTERGVLQSAPHSVVVVPASDEATYIEACLRGLATAVRRASKPTTILLMVNNTTDDTEQRALKFVENAALDAVVVTLALPPSGGVGLARAAGFALAASLSPDTHHYLTTDADSVVDADWLTRSLHWLTRCEAVCGLVSISPWERAGLPVSIDGPGALEGRYWQLAMEIETALDPDPLNPWPHHGRASGASLGFQAAIYQRIGGFQPVPSDEDTDLIRRFKDSGYRVKYADDVKVDTSCRLVGRAPGGMADALARRIRDLNSVADSALEPAATHILRIRARRQCRMSLRNGQPLDTLARFLGVDPVLLDCVEREESGSLWSRLERLSPRLERKRLRPTELPREIAILERDLRLLKTGGTRPPDSGPSVQSRIDTQKVMPSTRTFT